MIKKSYYNEDRDSKLECCKRYNFLNREKTNVCLKNKTKTDLNYKLAQNIGVRTCQTFKS